MGMKKVYHSFIISSATRHLPFCEKLSQVLYFQPTSINSIFTTNTKENGFIM